MITLTKTSRPADTDRILQVHAAAFGPEEGPEIVSLVSALLQDSSASPLLSLLALDGARACGHILFSRAEIEGHEKTLQASLLCPLAVVPEYQAQGVGSRLVDEGLKQLRASGVDLVFVLGHPGYYPRFGFRPAGRSGLHAPYPIADKNADAWMVKALKPGQPVNIRGTATLCCADAVMHPGYWIE